jgi:hypothetical protein
LNLTVDNSNNNNNNNNNNSNNSNNNNNNSSAPTMEQAQRHMTDSFTIGRAGITEDGSEESLQMLRWQRRLLKDLEYTGGQGPTVPFPEANNQPNFFINLWSIMIYYLFSRRSMKVHLTSTDYATKLSATCSNPDCPMQTDLSTLNGTFYNGCPSNRMQHNPDCIALVDMNAADLHPIILRTLILV